MFLQDPVHPTAVYLEILVHQQVAKPDHLFPPLGQLRMQKPAAQEQVYQVARALETTHVFVSCQVRCHIVDGLDRQF